MKTIKCANIDCSNYTTKGNNCEVLSESLKNCKRFELQHICYNNECESYSLEESNHCSYFGQYQIKDCEDFKEEDTKTPLEKINIKIYQQLLTDFDKWWETTYEDKIGNPDIEKGIRDISYSMWKGCVLNCIEKLIKEK